jgi:hypothetical protein
MGDVLRLAHVDRWHRARQLQARRTAAAASRPAPATSFDMAVVHAAFRLRATLLRLTLEAKKNALLIEQAECRAQLLQIVMRNVLKVPGQRLNPSRWARPPLRLNRHEPLALSSARRRFFALLASFGVPLHSIRRITDATSPTTPPRVI